MQSFSINWNLQSLSNFHNITLITEALISLKTKIFELEKEMSQTPIGESFENLQKLESECQELESLISCLLAQNTKDEQAILLYGQIKEIRTSLENVSLELNQKLTKLEDEAFDRFLKDQKSKEVQFILKERKNWTFEKLPLEKERIINNLSIDGYQGWDEIYNTLMGQIHIPFKDQFLSVGQAENKLSSSNREERKEIFQQWDKTWKENENVFSQILNHLGGFRIQAYKARGWNDILKEPLHLNRMKRETLEAMWGAIDKKKNILLPYLSSKANLLGIPQLNWYDIEASVGKASTKSLSYQNAAEMIIDQFNDFSKSMGDFAKKSFENHWIEAEDRPNKLPGGFCSWHPKSKQSRIFMTYSGTFSNLFTLAHELGHAYHDEQVKDLPYFGQQYRMNVAETASTMAENILVNSILSKTKDPQEKLGLLDTKLQRATIFLMNIHSRFLFETKFYEKRKNGAVLAEELNLLMLESQKEGFLNSLDEWYPRFWISKRHFYSTEVPFYNFPYTFGYLFSLSLYALARKCGNDFYKKYDLILKDTGCMSVEDLAQKHLGIDLTASSFWDNGLELIKEDVTQFLSLSKCNSNE